MDMKRSLRAFVVMALLLVASSQGDSCTTQPDAGSVLLGDLGTLLETAVGFIPDVGGLMYGVISIFWPMITGASGPTRDLSQCAWNAIQNYVTSVVTTDIDQNNVARLQNTLQGVSTVLVKYQQFYDANSTAAQQAFKSMVYTPIAEFEPQFTQTITPSQPADMLPVILPWAAMAISMYQENYCNGSVYWDSPTDALRPCNLNDFKNAVNLYVQVLQNTNNNITSYESARYYIDDSNWSSQQTQDCDCSVNPETGGYDCTDTCLYGSVNVVNRYANNQVLGSYGFDQSVSDGSTPYDCSPNCNTHDQALAQAQQQFHSVSDPNMQTVSNNWNTVAAPYLAKLQAIQAQLAADPTKSCGPTSGVNTITNTNPTCNLD